MVKVVKIICIVFREYFKIEDTVGLLKNVKFVYSEVFIMFILILRNI